MKSYRVIGWFSPNPFDIGVAPFAILASVEAASKEDAFLPGYDALSALCPAEGQLLNWYVEEVVGVGAQATVGA